MLAAERSGTGRVTACVAIFIAAAILFFMLPWSDAPDPDDWSDIPPPAFDGKLPDPDAPDTDKRPHWSRAER